MRGRERERERERENVPPGLGKPVRGRGTVVIHANPPQFQLVLCSLGRAFLRDKRVVGFWSWELESLPDVWVDAMRYVDALEVPSEFVRQILRRYTDKDCTCIPHAVPAPTRRKAVWARDGVIRCLYVFDAGSSWERKNPLAALRAFALAFAPGEAELTFKVSNAGTERGSYATFREQCAAVPGVRIVTENLTPGEMEELYVRHDVYLSLHRSEGYGLTLREAMLHGLHVVATGWSANMEFMQGELCHAVPFKLVQATFNRGPCKGLKTRWAEADTDAAAAILRDVRRAILNAAAGPRQDAPANADEVAGQHLPGVFG
ncbi:hypothetical protein [uncultured Desulfovibrio sp.]|uniref:glycosyltransferase n=1 Tax=uncultured Desulfovibrio sp. TaxID=167968 RepID=UPI0026204F67|nr:hypothetical protein [uncultured Desulfovibrio sp.]